MAVKRILLTATFLVVALATFGGPVAYAQVQFGGYTNTLDLGPAGAPDSTLDLLQKGIVVRTTPYSTVESYAAYAWNGFSWGNPGLTSSVAAVDPNFLGMVGVAQGVNFNIANGNFMGVSVDDAWTVARYTWLGDVNMDGNLSPDDGGILMYYWDLQPDPGTVDWAMGDLNHDGSLTPDDGGLLMYAWDLQPPPLGMSPAGAGSFVPSGAIAGGSAATPEPSSLALLLAGGVMGLWMGWRKIQK